MSSNTSTQLSKGEACLVCRHRKIKCDGIRPICGPCAASVPSHCKYEGESEQRTLKEQISAMEDRINQLQSSRGMTLHHPYNPETGPASALNLRELPTEVRRGLLRSFIPHSTEFCFFLHGSRFQSSSEEPSLALTSAIYLMGAYFSPDKELSALQPELLNQALRESARGLSSNHSHKVLHTIQAEVLLAQYLFLQGRHLEGKYRISTATSIVLGAGFHKIRSDQQQFPPRSGMALPPPRDATEEVERVNALWAVVILNNCWTPTDGTWTNIFNDMPEYRIDAPWPLDLFGETEPQFPSDLRSGYTVQNFLANANGVRSLSALHSKSAVLFQRVSLLLGQHSPNMDVRQAAKFQVDFNKLDSLTRRFISELPPLSQAPSRGTVRNLLVIHTLTRVSAMQLHSVFAGQDPKAQSYIWSTALSIAALLREAKLNGFPFIDPFMGILWMATAKVFVDELTAGRGRPSHPQRPRPEEMVAAVETVMSVMTFFAPHSPLIDAQLAQIRRSVG
ncbi:hypothetical protein L218DRAFT_962206 [Marasmius fiardii PR-910]|nr:hypothetical protein L218DRAFT_962206 [Marasmius fiardii PR-910]